MGPRIYPSQQDTNLTAKGSFILTLSNTFINDIQVSVNGLLRDVEYSNLNGYYTTNIDINDIVTILLRSNPTNYYKTINILRRDYTTDEVSGNNGIVDTSISNNNSFSTTGLTATFTATTLNYSYNFEYRISASIIAGTPTPTPTPSPTPTPPPFVINNGAVGGPINDLLIDGSDNVHIIGNFAGFDEIVTERSNFITKTGPNGGVLSGYTNIGYLVNSSQIPLANVMTFTIDDKIMMGGKFFGWQDPVFLPNDLLNTSDIIKMNKDTRNAYQVYPVATNTGVTQNGFVGFGINDIVQQSDSKFIIGGNFGSYSGVTAGDIVRINDNGTIDSSFNSGGVGFTSGEVKSIQLQSDNKILVGGDFISFNGFTTYGIVRLNSNGTRDTSFTSYFNNDIEFLDAIVNKIQIQPDGKILVAGLFYSYSGNSRQSIIRLNTNGTLDTTFGSTSGFTGPYFLDGTYYGKVNDMILQSDGKILCAGEFTGYSGVSSNNIIRLNNDGTIDTTFSVGTGFNGPVYTLARQSTGNIMVGGDFTSYNGYGPIGRIARLSPDGGNNTLYVPLPTSTPTPSPTPLPPTPTPSLVNITLQRRYIGSGGSSASTKTVETNIVTNGVTYTYSGLTWTTSINNIQSLSATSLAYNPTFSYTRRICKTGSSQIIDFRDWKLLINGSIDSGITQVTNVTITDCGTYVTQTLSLTYIGTISSGDVVELYLQDGI
jgi:uncharacterized delta-60 repeat protein